MMSEDYTDIERDEDVKYKDKDEDKSKRISKEKLLVESYRRFLDLRVEKVLGADAPVDKNISLENVLGIPLGSKLDIGLEFLRACERGNPETLEIFFEHGMDVNFQDPKTGQTALHVASAAQAHNAIHALLATEQCDFLIRDNKGRLSSEMAYLYGNDPELAELLGNKEREQAEAKGIKLTRRPPSKPQP